MKHLAATALLLGMLATTAQAQPAPEFTHDQAGDWINSAPLLLESLRGEVVLIDFWTYICVNCTRSVPWMKRLEADYTGKGLSVIGVHTPEFEYDKDRDKVRQQTRHLGIAHPVMIDNDRSYWNAMRNRYWPAFYLIDKRGQLRGHFAGETHSGDAQDKAIREAIDALLSERG